MNELEKILKDNGIKPAKKETVRESFDAKFNNPMEMLDDLFNNIFPAIGRNRKNEI